MDNAESSYEPQASTDLELSGERRGDSCARRRRDGQAGNVHRLLETQLTHYIDLLQGISDLAEEIEGLMDRTTSLVRGAQFRPCSGLSSDCPTSRADSEGLPGELKSGGAGVINEQKNSNLSRVRL